MPRPWIPQPSRAEPDEKQDQDHESETGAGASGWNAQSESAEPDEAEFDCWLEEKLTCERKAFVAHLQDMVSQKLSSHHRSLIESVEHNWGLRITEHSNAGIGRDSCFSRRVTAGQAGKRSHYNSYIAPPPPPPPPCPAPEKVISNHLLPVGAVPTEKRKYKSPYLAGLSSPRTSARAEAPRLARLVESSSFEFGCCALILVNMAVICLEVQYTGCRLTASMQHQDARDSCTDLLLSPKAEPAFTAAAVLFSLCFTVEFVLRALHLKWQAFLSVWMWLDFIVLSFGMLDTITRLVSEADVSINPTAMRTARMARMLRMAKVFKGRDTFHTLYLLMKSIVASKHALGWSLSILYCTMTCVGLLINQTLYNYLADTTVDVGERKAVYDYFGTYTRLMCTMFEITLGNWAPPSRILMEKLSQWWGVMIVLYRCVFCFSLVHVVAAVFISETNRVASDDEVLMLRKSKNDEKTARVLGELFTEIDESNDGFISMSELKMAMEDKLMQSILDILDMDMYDLEHLYALMDDGTGQVPQEGFIRNVLRLRGPAKTSKLVAMMQLIDCIDAKVDGVSSAVAALTRGMTPSSPVRAPSINEDAAR